LNEVRELRLLREENRKLKGIVADLTLELSGNWVRGDWKRAPHSPAPHFLQADLWLVSPIHIDENRATQDLACKPPLFVDLLSDRT
jgi:hypothetical protein